MHHPTIISALAQAKQQDIERVLRRPDRMARRELELRQERERSLGPSRRASRGGLIARLAPVGRRRAPVDMESSWPASGSHRDAEGSPC